MNWDYCEYCVSSGNCENQVRMHECNSPVKELFRENQQLKELLRECREWIEFLDVKMKSEKNPKNAMYFEVLLLKIDNAIGEKK